jgi:hypothetical protein
MTREQQKSSGHHPIKRKPSQGSALESILTFIFSSRLLTSKDFIQACGKFGMKIGMK